MGGYKIPQIIDELITDLVQYTRTINWNNYYAKWSRDHKRDQSLLVHSINQVGVLKQLYEKIIDPDIVPAKEQLITSIAIFFSDTGKSLSRFQDAAISGATEKEAYNHINAEAIELVDSHLEFLKDIFKVKYKLYETEQEWATVKNEIKRNVCYHQRVKAPDLKNSCAKFGGAGSFSSLIDYIDDLTSQKTIENAYRFAGKKDGVEHLFNKADFTYHKFSKIRGLLTVFFNEALIEIHARFGYEPILYYPDGVLYIAPEKNSIATKLEDIISLINEKIQQLMDSEQLQTKLNNIVFGPITQTIVLFPPLLNKKCVRLRIKNELSKSQTPQKYQKNIQDFEKKKFKKSDSEEYEGRTYFEFITDLGKEFNVTKELLIEYYTKYQSVITYAFAVIEEYIKWGEKKNPDYRIVVEKLVQKYFPFVNFELIRSGYANTANKINKFNMLIGFWKKNNPELLITSLQGIETFENNLIKLLDEIYDAVKDLKGQLIPPEMIKDILLDLHYSELGTLTNRYPEIAQNLARNYSEGKTDKNHRNCFFCGLTYYNDAIKERIGEGPRKFSNKLIGGKRVASGHQAGICSLCETEATLRKIIMGSLPSEIILLSPEINMSTEIRRQWAAEIKLFLDMKNCSISLLNEKTLSKAIKNIALAEDNIIKNINAKWLSENIIYSKDKMNKIKKGLQEFYEKIEDFNEDYGTPFTSFEELIDAILMRRWWAADLERFLPTAEEIEYIYETANYLFIFLRYSLKRKEEPESSGYLRKLFFGILISIIFNARIKFISDLNPILYHELEGLVSVPYTSLIDVINRCINPDQIIKFDNRFDVLKRLASLIALENMLPNSENDFLLKYMKSSRGFLLHKFHETKVNRNDLLILLENLPKFNVEI